MGPARQREASSLGPGAALSHSHSGQESRVVNDVMPDLPPVGEAVLLSLLLETVNLISNK
jgi:hypothetical protein